MDGNRVLKGLALLAPCLLLTAFLLATVGCKEKKVQSPQVKQKIVHTKKTPAPTPEASVQKVEVPEPEKPDLLPLEAPAPEETTPSVRSKTKRDPFRSFIEIKTRVSPVRKPRKIMTPLQRYSLDQLKVVGIVQGFKVHLALLEDDVGKGYTVSIGEAVGNQGGKIAAIQPDRIIIKETYQDALGKKKVRSITKRLFSAEESQRP